MTIKEFGIYLKDESLATTPLFKGTEGQVAYRWNRMGVDRLNCFIQPVLEDEREYWIEWIPDYDSNTGTLFNRLKKVEHCI